MKKENFYPPQLALSIFAWINDKNPPVIGKNLRKIFFAISPDLSSSISSSYSNKSTLNAFYNGFLVGLIFNFFAITVISYFENVLYPFSASYPVINDNNIIYFFEDSLNLIMYIIIDPLFFGLSFSLYIAARKIWSNFPNLIEKRSNITGFKGIIVIILVVLVSALAISNYMFEIVNSKIINTHHYWFLGSPENGNKLSFITVYYTILNFITLVVVLGTSAMWVSAVRPIIRLGDNIENLELGKKIIKKEVLFKLKPFADIYFISKMYLLTTLIHVSLWNLYDLSNTINYIIEASFILIVASIFIAIPKQYLFIKWYRHVIKLKDNSIEKLPKNYVSIYQLRAIQLSNLFIGSIYINIIRIMINYFWPNLTLFQ